MPTALSIDPAPSRRSATGQASPAAPWLSRAGLAALCLFGLGLRAHRLGEMDLWYDEVALWLYAVTGTASPPAEPPAIAWLLHAVMRSLGNADAIVAHAVSVVLGTLTIPVVHALARRVDGHAGTAWIAAILVAISPMAIDHSREVRPYASFMLTSSLVYLSLVRAWDRGRPADWAVYAAALFVCALSHVYMLQIGLLLGITAVAIRFVPGLSTLDPERRRQQFRRFALASLVASPAALWLIARIDPGTPEGTLLNQGYPTGSYRFGPATYLRNLAVNFGPGPVRAYTELSIGVPEVLGGLLLLAFLAGLWCLERRRRREPLVLFVLAIGIPVGFNYLMLGRASDWPWMRFVAHSLVPYGVVASIGLGWLVRSVPSRWAAPAMLAAIAALTLPNSVRPFQHPEYAEYRAIAAYLGEHADRLKGVIVLPYMHSYGLADRRITNIYHLLKRESLPAYHVDNPSLEVGIARIRRVEQAPTLVNATRVPRSAAEPETRLPSGSYAVLTRRDLESCRQLSEWIESDPFEAAGATVMRGLAVCELEFRDR